MEYQALREALKALRDAAVNTPALDDSREWSDLIARANAALAPVPYDRDDPAERDARFLRDVDGLGQDDDDEPMNLGDGTSDGEEPED